MLSRSISDNLGRYPGRGWFHDKGLAVEKEIDIGISRDERAEEKGGMV